MASGLVALLDDVAAIAKLAAASIDDVGAAASKASMKAAGVVVDDTAVTPGYAMGFTPERELPIVAKIAVGSLKNKFLFLLPGALLLSAFAPWLVTPILMLGGSYLCFEATEKIIEAFAGHDDLTEHPEELALSSEEMEKAKVAGAIRTDFILSAEIMAIALSEVADRSFGVQAAALVVVALAITVGVYGVVGLIVKMDDIGVHLAARRRPWVQKLGRGMVKTMPVLLDGLAKVGTAAMLWVGGGIIVHSLHEYHVAGVADFVETVQHALQTIPGVGGAASWIASALISGVVGLALGGLIVLIVHRLAHGKKH
jgi:predicted DNA repair protein MutK